MEYNIESWAVMKPDVYAGESCEGIEPRWMLQHEKEGEEPVEDITLLPAHFPPGTRITISVPVCPDCSTPADFSHDFKTGVTGKCECGFDWEAWTLSEFS